MLILLWFWWPTPGAATIVVAGSANLTSSGHDTLTWLLTNLPASLYPHLQVVLVDAAALPTDLPGCGYEWVGEPATPCRIHIWSSGESISENPFPVDAPQQISTSSFYAVAAHELGHNVDAWAYRARDGAAWKDRLVADAGCEPMQYLRSMLPSCYFRDAPQELVASIFNQWMACSECVFALALSRWDAGYDEPINQAIYLLWLMGSQPAGRHAGVAGTVLGYRVVDGLSTVTMLTVRPWRCSGDMEIAGSGWSLAVTLDADCRVTAIGDRHGL